MECCIKTSEIVPPFPHTVESMRISDDALFYISGVGSIKFINDGKTIWELTVEEEKP